MIFLILGTEYAIWLGVDDGRGIRKLRQTSIDCLS